MPKETAEIGAKVLKTGSVYKLVGDEIFTWFRDGDFADLYSPEGKPAISPVILAFVTIFQFIEKYPDRQAAEALRMRIDWKYALHLSLDYQGFDFSVLSEFPRPADRARCGPKSVYSVGSDLSDAGIDQGTREATHG